MIEFEARMGRGVDLGTFTFTAASGDLANSKARVVIGSPTETKLTILNDPAPAAPAVCNWTVDGEVGTLAVDLSPEQINACGAGFHTIVIDILRESGTPIHSVQAMTHQLHVQPWPV